LERRIPWAGESVTRTGKKLELGLRKKYVGPERGFPGSSGLGEPMGEVRGKRPGGGSRERIRGVSEGCRPEENRTGQGGSISEH